MKISQLMIIASVLAISIPGAYYAFRAYGNETGETKAATDLSGEITLLKSEIDSLKKANSELNEIKNEKGESILQTQARNDDKTKDDHQDETQTKQINPNEMAKKQEEQSANDLEHINNAFIAEASDPQWAPETTALVTSFFETEAGAKIDLADIECRKTLCKVEINNPNTADANDNLMLSFPIHVAKALSQASVFNEQNDDGTTRVIMYLARNGYELPTEF